jgi:hypothetical protein
VHRGTRERIYRERSIVNRRTIAYLLAALFVALVVTVLLVVAAALHTPTSPT